MEVNHMHSGDTVVVSNRDSSFNGRIGRVVEVRPFDVLVRLPSLSAPTHRTVTFPFGRGELRPIEVC